MVALALAWPTWGPNRLATQLGRQGVAIAPSTVYRTLRRLRLGTRRERLRRRYFTQLAQLQHSLDGFLRFYNHERPHHGYRTRGRTPAALFLGANA